MINWLNGFWLETYVASMFLQNPLKALVDDVKVNIVAENPQFELDLMFMVKNQLFVISISTTSDHIRGGKSTLKKKIFEVIVRSRQIGGWKTHFGLICLANNPDKLEREVENYFIDRKVKVFGRNHILSLGSHLVSWINSH